MVKYYQPPLDPIFDALGDKTRRAILAELTGGERSAGELAAPFAMSAPAISKHLKVLENASLIARRREGRMHYFRLRPETLSAATDWINAQRRLWQHCFDRLDRLLAAQTHSKKGASHRDANAQKEESQ